MRTVVYRDIKIPKDEYKQLIKEYSDFLHKTTGIKAKFWVTDYDFTDYPTFIDTDGDDVMRPAFLQDIADDVDQKYGDWGADNIITLIHEDNWKSGSTATRRGIWGTNYSYRFNNYHVQYCRWDKDNIANSFGTLNHEIDHTFDALIKQEIGIDINPILKVGRYDRDTTHGGADGYEYIRYKENEAKLKKLTPYLKAAYQRRQDRHTEHVKELQWSIVGILEKLVYLLKRVDNKKVGVPKR